MGATSRRIIHVRRPEAADVLEWMEPALHVETLHLAMVKQAQNNQKKRQDPNRDLAHLEKDGTIKAVLVSHGY
jgi:hypothetical protein